MAPTYVGSMMETKPDIEAESRHQVRIRYYHPGVARGLEIMLMTEFDAKSPLFFPSID